ncbi:MAG: Crp/Fnr family transcriptional regulator [Treponema sp.]|nr:Crp/Fnr family transcriptional regulator [Treponema sp.]
MADNYKPVFVKFPKDAFIFVEGKPSAGRFYIIKEGKVLIFHETDWETDEENVAGPGEMFGIVSAMASYSYIESATAMTDVLLMVVERKQYGDLIRMNNSVAVNTVRIFSQRLRKLDEELSRQALKSAAMNDPSHLYQIGEFYEKNGKSNQALYSYYCYLAYNPHAKNSDDVKRKILRLKPRATVTRPKYSPDTMIQKYPKDCLIFAEGEIGHNLYVIQGGSVKITKIVNNNEVVLAVLNKGDIFGEMAMLENKPRSATAEVYEDCTLLAVNRANFKNLINDQPDMIVRMTVLMSERIWLLYKQLATSLIENPVGRIYDALLTQIEKNRIDLNSKDPYLCNFGFTELAGMAGISKWDSTDLYGRIESGKKIAVVNDKVFVTNVSDLNNEAEYYRRARKKAQDAKK